MNDPLSPSERPQETDRGFMSFDTIDAEHGATVRVYESSSAEGCKVWLNAVDIGCHSATVELDEDAALRLVRQLVYLLDHHHNAVSDDDDGSTPEPPEAPEPGMVRTEWARMFEDGEVLPLADPYTPITDPRWLTVNGHPVRWVKRTVRYGAWTPADPAAPPVPEKEPEADRVRRELDLLRAELDAAMAAAATADTCDLCGMGEGFAQHHDRTFKGYHAFEATAADAPAKERCQTCPAWDGADCGGCYLIEPDAEGQG